MGGEVVGESLRCPMHAFRFATDGGCVATGYGTKPPPLARAQKYPVFEQDGLVFVWLGRQGEPPSFQIPAVGVDGWSPFKSKSWALESHVQETTENSVDLGHLSVVHGYRDVEATSALQTQGPYLTASYAFSRAPILGRGSALRVFYTVHVYGLGYSYVAVEVPKFNLRTQQYFLARPIGPNRIELTILARARFNRASKSGYWHNRLPMRAINSLACSAVFQAYQHDVQQDFVFWANKRYKESPALAQGDGPIGRYRRWARQFYVGTSHAAAMHS